MKYILFLSMILIIVFLVLYNNKKMAIIKHQLMIAKNQNSSLRHKISNYSSISKIKISFLTPENKYGIIDSNTKILLAPVKDSVVLNTNGIKMEVYIIDMAEINNSLWYYVAIPSDNNINSRGWVNQKDFTILYSTSRNITKK